MHVLRKYERVLVGEALQSVGIGNATGRDQLSPRSIRVHLGTSLFQLSTSSRFLIASRTLNLMQITFILQPH
jgi:hypothetical protein